jgi:uncharacterized protein YjbJ (UPF0337 family)
METQKVFKLIKYLFNSLGNFDSMNSTTKMGNWNDKKNKIKQKFADWKDDDLMYVAGKMDDLYGKIQKMRGNPKVKAYKMANDR